MSEPRKPGERRRPRGVPREAEERNVQVRPPYVTADYFLGGRQVAWVLWEEGRVESEKYFDEQGRQHGVERYRHANGRVKWESRWKHGLLHGKTRQWDEKGTLLLETRFVRGTGIDVWWDGGTVSEVREMKDGRLHGLERWGTPRRVYIEKSWFEGWEHGIWREWNSHGRLSRGFPRYYVHGVRVTRRAYLSACARDPTLPRYIPRDDRPARTPLPAALAAVSRRE